VKGVLECAGGSGEVVDDKTASIMSAMESCYEASEMGWDAAGSCLSSSGLFYVAEWASLVGCIGVPLVALIEKSFPYILQLVV